MRTHDAHRMTHDAHMRTQVGDGGAIALSGSLCSEHCALTTLQLGSNNIGDPGALALARPSPLEYP